MRVILLQRRIGGSTRRGDLRAAALAATICALAYLLVAAPAFAGAAIDKEDFAPFANCPTASAALCIVSDTTGGEFKLGNKTVPIPQGTTIELQGGLPLESYGAQTLLAPATVPALSDTPLAVPGGLAGVGGIGGEVYATAELAGPVEVRRADLVIPIGPVVTLPIRVHLTNQVLGEDCYIGSEAEPIVLNLTVGKTDPPSPAEPIEGHHGKIEYKDRKRLLYAPDNTIVDNDFAVPGVSGCGGSLSALIDPLVDLDIGLPASAGQSKVVMDATLEETASKWAAKYKPKVKKSKN